MNLDIKNHIISEYIENNYKNLRQFTEEFGFDYGNLYKALKKGVGVALASRIENIIFAKTGVRIFQTDQNHDDSNTGYIPEYSAKLSAGGGFSATEETVVDNHPMDLRELQRRGWKIENLCIFPVIGKSMLPAIQDGTKVIVDTSKTQVSDGRVYALTKNGELFIKRVFREPGTNQYIGKSDNLTYPHVLFEDGDEVQIVGLVVYKLGEDVF